MTLDLNGLTTAGTATGIVQFGSLAGIVPLFNQIAVINNPNNFSVKVVYNAGSIDVIIVPGTPAPPVTSALHTDIWDGASTLGNNWSDPANWVGNTAPSAGDNLVFPAGAAQFLATDDFTTGNNFNSITISGVGYTLSGLNSLTLQAGITTTNPAGTNTISIPLVLGANETFLSTYATTTLTVSGTLSNNSTNTLNTSGFTLTVDGTGSTTIGAVIGGAGGLVKNGPGTLSITGTNTYAGLTTLNAGIAQDGNVAGLGATTAGTVVNAGATLQITIGTTINAEPLTLNGGGFNNNPTIAAGALTNGFTLNGVTTGFIANWSGPITLASNASIASVLGTLTISGAVTLAGHTLTLNSGGSTTFSNAIGIVPAATLGAWWSTAT